MLWRVAARLHVGSASPRLQSSLGDHHCRLFVLNALLQQLNVLVHVEDLLKNLHRSTAACCTVVIEPKIKYVKIRVFFT